jgi:hypothetical protein
MRQMADHIEPWSGHQAPPVPPLWKHQGKIVMRGIDSIIRLFILAQGLGLRWLREELHAARVNIRLTDGCLTELVRDADCAVIRSSTNTKQSYVERLRTELAVRASFIQRWTGSDEKLSPRDEESLQELVRIARKYALPRRWKLSDPVVVEYRRTVPSYLQWTNDIDSDAVPQS